MRLSSRHQLSTQFIFIFVSQLRDSHRYAQQISQRNNNNATEVHNFLEVMPHLNNAISIFFIIVLTVSRIRSNKMKEDSEQLKFSLRQIDLNCKEFLASKLRLPTNNFDSSPPAFPPPEAPLSLDLDRSRVRSPPSARSWFLPSRSPLSDIFN